MPLILKKGKISNLREVTNIHGRNGNVGTSHSSTFRIDGIPVSLTSGKYGNLSNNDEVTCVGEMKGGTFKVYGLRNNSTGEYNETKPTLLLAMGICFIILGLLTVILIIGIVPLAIGIYVIYKATIGYKAVNMLANAR